MSESESKSIRQTRRWVLFADKVADYTIRIGGILVIGVVLGMLVFLVYEVAPLFRGGFVSLQKAYQAPQSNSNLKGISLDEYKTLAASITSSGEINVWHAGSGVQLEAGSLDFKGKQVTSFAKTNDDAGMVFGFQDGTVHFGKLTFQAEVLLPEQLPTGLRELNETDATDGKAVYSKIPGNQYRRVQALWELSDELKISEQNQPITAIDYRLSLFSERPKKILLARDASGDSYLNISETKLNLFTRQTKTTVSQTKIPPLPEGADPKFLFVNDTGEEILFVEKDSTLYRYNIRDFSNPILAEKVKLLPDGVELTAFGVLAGGKSIVTGGSDGSVKIFFVLQQENVPTKDGYQLVHTRTFESHTSPVSLFAAGRRGKLFATGDAQGNIWVRYGTNPKALVKLATGNSLAPTDHIILASRNDGVLATSGGKNIHFWGISVPHPEISFDTLFGKIWYESYPAPTYTWQSTGATDDFEPKLSLIPLIFGTIKATVYALLFAIPIALLGAVYTSEFLPYKVRNKVKPVMEIMASIPSVVLGFIAALVLAPIAENWITAVIIAFAIIPLTFILFAFGWQILPPKIVVRFGGIPKFFLFFVVMFVGLLTVYKISPFIERYFFAGSFTSWLNGSIGRPVPFLFLLNVPVAALIISLCFNHFYGYRFSMYLRTVSMPYSALLDLLRWSATAGVTVIVSIVAALILEKLGFDPRHTFLGTYVQRNTLIVGFAMGFAVIPLIYTLAEDALNSVPEHLRSASLGCGATPWQTAKWIILPTAISGVFSAIMIGMGRAVGETMIVVMAAGNTPLIDWNIFNGLRALSANIAVELPEAPKDGTLYRVLFLTGLVLFSMTFAINTIAELIRIKFRKRAMQL